MPHVAANSAVVDRHMRTHGRSTSARLAGAPPVPRPMELAAGSVDRAPHGAALFGLAHFAGGWGYVLVAGVAAVGYGLTYRIGGLQVSVMARFGLNLLHFSLFTYPMLAS